MTKTKQKPGTKKVVFGKREEKLFKKFAKDTTQEQLALICGVSPQTLQNIWADDRQPEFRHLYDLEQAKLAGHMSNMLINRAETSDACLIFFLKMRHHLYQPAKEVDPSLTEEIAIKRFDGSVDPLTKE